MCPTPAMRRCPARFGAQVIDTWSIDGVGTAVRSAARASQDLTFTLIAGDGTPRGAVSRACLGDLRVRRIARRMRWQLSAWIRKPSLRRKLTRDTPLLRPFAGTALPLRGSLLRGCPSRRMAPRSVWWQPAAAPQTRTRAHSSVLGPFCDPMPVRL